MVLPKYGHYSLPFRSTPYIHTTFILYKMSILILHFCYTYTYIC